MLFILAFLRYYYIVVVDCFHSTENPIGKYAGIFILYGFEHGVVNMFYFPLQMHGQGKHSFGC